MVKAYVRQKMDAKERLAFRSEPGPNGCINFTGSKGKFGHGELAYKGVRYRAHRLAYIAYIGPIPDGLVVCHACDNPSCINPEHLFIGTQADNLADARKKKRMKAPLVYGEQHGLSRLTESDVLKIREDNRPYRQIARDYGVNPSTIKRAKTGETWGHIGGQ